MRPDARALLAAHIGREKVCFARWTTFGLTDRLTALYCQEKNVSASDESSLISL